MEPTPSTMDDYGGAMLRNLLMKGKLHQAEQQSPPSKTSTSPPTTLVMTHTSSSEQSGASSSPSPLLPPSAEREMSHRYQVQAKAEPSPPVFEAAKAAEAVSRPPFVHSPASHLPSGIPPLHHQPHLQYLYHQHHYASPYAVHMKPHLPHQPVLPPHHHFFTPNLPVTPAAHALSLPNGGSYQPHIPPSAFHRTVPGVEILSPPPSPPENEAIPPGGNHVHHAQRQNGGGVIGNHYNRAEEERSSSNGDPGCNRDGGGGTGSSKKDNRRHAHRHRHHKSNPSILRSILNSEGGAEATPKELYQQKDKTEDDDHPTLKPCAIVSDNITITSAISSHYVEIQSEPIDLSMKTEDLNKEEVERRGKKRRRHSLEEDPDAFSSTSSDAESNEPESPSILRRILDGRGYMGAFTPGPSAGGNTRQGVCSPDPLNLLTSRSGSASPASSCCSSNSWSHNVNGYSNKNFSSSLSNPASPASSSSSHGTGGGDGQRPSMNKVKLARKNMLPVLARVSDWFTKMVQFAKELPEFNQISESDRRTLMINAWARLLLLQMSENNFHFAVTRCDLDNNESFSSRSESPTGSEASFSRVGKNSSKAWMRQMRETPTMAAVETIQSLIAKCQSLNIDAEEYVFLMKLVLFNKDLRDLEEPLKVSSIHSTLQQDLQDHISKLRVGDPLASPIQRYTRLLLSLPVLYSVEPQMLETLFCKQAVLDQGGVVALIHRSL